jgi:hypothetical protein
VDAEGDDRADLPPGAVTTGRWDATAVRSILEHATDHPWRVQGIGLLALWLDDRREHRLHVWDPDEAVGEAPIHDHPYDFSSTIVVGHLVDTRYTEDPAGDEYRRERYSPTDEEDRRVDTVRLAATTAAFGPGDRYAKRAAELHDSRQDPGTVTVIRCTWRERPELTVCLPPGAPWVSAVARPATTDEVERITGLALQRFRAGEASGVRQEQRA